MRKNVKKKSLKYLEITFRKPYLCTRFERESNAPEQRQVLKKFWKKFRKFLEFPKFDLPLHPLWQWHPVGDEAKKVLKKFSKNLPKRFGGFKKGFYLCTTFRSAKAADGTAEGDLPKRTEIVLYSNISNSVLWSIWAAKVFPLSSESDFKQYLWD